MTEHTRTFTCQYCSEGILVPSGENRVKWECLSCRMPVTLSFMGLLGHIMQSVPQGAGE